MNKKPFQEYSKLEDKIKGLEQEKLALRELCLEEMQKEKVDQVKSDFGTFSITERKSWTYSPKVAKQEKEVKSRYDTLILPLENEVKELKKKEEESGVAKAKISSSLRYQASKTN